MSIVEYYRLIAACLWFEGSSRRDEALEQLVKGRIVRSRARLTAGVDETSVEFVTQYSEFAQFSVKFPLESGRHSLAMDAVQDGKANVLGDSRSALEDYQAARVTMS